MSKHCQPCNKDFYNPPSLKRHTIAKHADKIPAFINHEHRCSICGAKFVRKDALRRHNLSKHTLEQMKRCQFCQANFRRDYFPRHESTCARKYWAKFCRNADLTKGIRDDQSNEISRHPPIRRDMSSDAPLVLAKAGDKGLRVVHDIDIDTRLASRAFDFVFVHCAETGDFESLSEAITSSFRHSVPIKPPEGLGVPHTYPLDNLFWLATRVGEYVCGERDLNDEDYYGNILLDHVCTAGAASLLEPLFWRGADFNVYSLLQAIRSGSFDTLRFCLALGADPNTSKREKDFYTNPLLVASAESETSHIAALLVEHGADVFVRDYNKLETPLHKAAQRADVELLHVLLAEDSSPDFLDANNDEGYSALEVAIESIHDCGVPQDEVLNFATALLDAGAGADCLDYRLSALDIAVRSECGAIVRLLLDKEPDSTQKTEYLENTLEEAVHEGFENVTRILVEAGATVNDEVLEEALRWTSLEVVELFLKAGARVDRIPDVVLKRLFEAAQDQRLSGRTDADDGLFDHAVAKYELLCLHFPEDERLRDLHSGTGIEEFGT